MPLYCYKIRALKKYQSPIFKDELIEDAVHKPTWASLISLFRTEFQSLTRFAKGPVAALVFHLSDFSKIPNNQQFTKSKKSWSLVRARLGASTFRKSISIKSPIKKRDLIFYLSTITGAAPR